MADLLRDGRGVLFAVSRFRYRVAVTCLAVGLLVQVVDVAG